MVLTREQFIELSRKHGATGKFAAYFKDEIWPGSSVLITPKEHKKLIDPEGFEGELRRHGVSIIVAGDPSRFMSSRTRKLLEAEP